MPLTRAIIGFGEAYPPASCCRNSLPPFSHSSPSLTSAEAADSSSASSHGCKLPVPMPPPTLQFLTRVAMLISRNPGTNFPFCARTKHLCRYAVSMRRNSTSLSISLYKSSEPSSSQAGRQTIRQTGTLADRQACRHVGRQTGMDTNSQTKQTGRQGRYTSSQSGRQVSWQVGDKDTAGTR